MSTQVEDARVLEYRLKTVNGMIDAALDRRDRKAFTKARGLRMQLLSKLAKTIQS